VRRVRAIVLLLGLAACGPDSGGSDSVTRPTAASTAVASVSLPGDSAPDPPRPEGPVGIEFDRASGRLLIPDGREAPRPLEAGAPLPSDELPRDPQPGVVFELVLVPRDVPAPPKAPEVGAEGLTAAAKLTAPVLKVSALPTGRLRVVVASRAMPLAFGSELRARHDRWGHVLVWPDATLARPLPAGTLRATLGERRVDATPLVAGKIVEGSPSKRLGQTVRVVDVESPLGKLRLELAPMPEAGLGGPLLCRALVELVGVDPSSAACRPDELALAATIAWVDGGGIDFVARAIDKRTDLPPGEGLLSPPGATLTRDGLPDAADGVYLTPTELAVFRKKPIELAPAPSAVREGFVADNARDAWMMLWLDGVPVVGVPAGAQRYVLGTLPGRYAAQWRSFLGDRVEPVELRELPGVLKLEAKRSASPVAPAVSAAPSAPPPPPP
jgi:hypothetical protein